MTGMTTAMVSMKAVVSHCAVAAPTENSSISSGSATDMIVSLRMTTKAAATSSPISRAAPSGAFCCAAEVGAAGRVVVLTQVLFRRWWA